MVDTDTRISLFFNVDHVVDRIEVEKTSVDVDAPGAPNEVLRIGNLICQVNPRATQGRFKLNREESGREVDNVLVAVDHRGDIGDSIAVNRETDLKIDSVPIDGKGNIIVPCCHAQLV